MFESKSRVLSESAAAALLFLCGPFVSSTVQGQSLPDGVTEIGPVSIPDSQRYTFESRNVDQTYLIDVVRIASPAAPQSDGPLPVVFVTDGNSMSYLTAGVAILNSIESLPPMYIVAIGFSFDPGLSPREMLLEFSLRRGRDYSPTGAFDAAARRRLEAAWHQYRSQMGLADAPYPSWAIPDGADNFLAFINDELKPFIARHYPDANVNDSALYGHSGGGWFVLNVLFTKPESFARYIAVSPGGPDGLLLPIAAKSDFETTKASLFLAFAEGDSSKIVGDSTALNSFFRANAHAGFEYTFQFFPGELHNSGVAGAFIRGLRAVFQRSRQP